MREPDLPHGLLDALTQGNPNFYVALVGCHAHGYHRPSCEHDILLAPSPSDSVSHAIIQGNPVDILHISERSFRSPPDTKTAMAVLEMHRVAGGCLGAEVLETAGVAERRRLRSRLATEMLSRCLRDVSRACRALEYGLVMDSAFWILSSSHQAAGAMLLSDERAPSPSHIVSLLRSGRTVSMMPLWSVAASLDKASVSNVRRRLRALEETVPRAERFLANSSSFQSAFGFRAVSRRGHLDGVRRKIAYLLGAHQPVEAYAYVGWEMTEFLAEAYERVCEADRIPPQHHSLIKEVSSKQHPVRILTDEAVKLLSLDVDQSSLQKRTIVLKEIAKYVARGLEKGKRG